jgi:hypothetical protein
MKLTDREKAYLADQKDILQGQIANIEKDIQQLKDDNPTVMLDTPVAMHKIRGLHDAEAYKRGRLAQILEFENLNKRETE